MKKEIQLLNTIKKTKLEYLRHIMRNSTDYSLKSILQGKVFGKRVIGRTRIKWLKNLRK